MRLRLRLRMKMRMRTTGRGRGPMRAVMKYLRAGGALGWTVLILIFLGGRSFVTRIWCFYTVFVLQILGLLVWLLRVDCRNRRLD